MRLQSRYIHGPSFFARSNFRNYTNPVGIKQSDRLMHVYIIGKSGTGKSTLLETMAMQDLHWHRGFGLVDPHGDLVSRIASQAAVEGRDVIYLDIPASEQPFAYNPLKRVPEDKRALAASGLLEVFKRTWADAWGVRMEHVMRNAILALIEQPNSKLPDLLRILTDDTFRKSVAARVSNEKVQRYWFKDYPKLPQGTRADITAVIQNKLDAFLVYPSIRKLLSGEGRAISFRQAMDERKVVLINLAKGLIGEDASSLLGGMLVTTMGLAAYSRADIPEAQRHPFHLYVDEFQNFTTLSFVAGLLSEARKFKLGLCLANQFLDQIDPAVRHAVLGNVGTIISFRVGPKDASFLIKEFQPSKLEAVDLLNLPNYNIYVKLLIDGQPSKPFSATTMRGQQPFDVFEQQNRERQKIYGHKIDPWSSFDLGYWK